MFGYDYPLLSVFWSIFHVMETFGSTSLVTDG